jgi:hypothetical protein
MVTTISKQSHENGGSSHTAQVNYGMGSAPAGSCITKIQIRGELSFDGIGALGDTSASFWEQLITHGVQFGAFGFTPADVTAFAAYDTGNWFYGAQPVPPGTSAVWSPSSNAAGAIISVPVDITVYPYFISGVSATDVYYSVGPLVAITQGWRLFASLRVWYD